MSNYEAILLGGEQPEQSLEALALQNVLGLDRTTMQPHETEEFDALLTVVRQFSRTNPRTGERQIISPSRLAAIPAITERHCRLQYPARGALTLDQIVESWRINMPTNDGTRYPDDLFDCAQWNFGTDSDTSMVERSIMQAELDRLELIERYRHMARTSLRMQRWNRSLDSDVTDEQVEAYVDRQMSGS